MLRREVQLPQRRVRAQLHVVNARQVVAVRVEHAQPRARRGAERVGAGERAQPAVQQAELLLVGPAGRRGRHRRDGGARLLSLAHLEMGFSD